MHECASPFLLPRSSPCVTGRFLRREKRFSVLVELDGAEVWAHTNNTGAMQGLTRPGTPALLSRASSPTRRLPFTLEALRVEDRAAPSPRGFWVGVNTSVPNRMLEALFRAGRLPFAAGFTEFRREVRRGASRLDACLAGPGLPPLWVECKNVTLQEDDMALFPDAAGERGRRHLAELMDAVAAGERAAMFYLIQRPDGRCFGPADCVDPPYAELFHEARRRGVEMHAMRAEPTPEGVLAGPFVPIARA